MKINFLFYWNFLWKYFSSFNFPALTNLQTDRHVRIEKRKRNMEDCDELKGIKMINYLRIFRRIFSVGFSTDFPNRLSSNDHEKDPSKRRFDSCIPKSYLVLIKFMICVLRQQIQKKIVYKMKKNAEIVVFFSVETYCHVL
jgi:hypothetical protein